MNRAWLLRCLGRLIVTTAVPLSVAVALVHGWDRVVAFLNGGWPPLVGNVANLLQIVTPIVAVAWWLTRAARSRTATKTEGTAPRALRLLALLLPPSDRDRFVREVTSILADHEPRQRITQLLSVAAAVPGLAVILRWGRRRVA